MYGRYTHVNTISLQDLVVIEKEDTSGAPPGLKNIRERTKIQILVATVVYCALQNTEIRSSLLPHQAKRSEFHER